MIMSKRDGTVRAVAKMIVKFEHEQHARQKISSKQGSYDNPACWPQKFGTKSCLYRVAGHAVFRFNA